MPPPDTRAPDIRALVTRYVTEVLNAGRFDLLDEICAPDYRRHLAPGAAPLDLAAQRARLEGIRRAFPAWELTLHEIVVEGDLATFRATVRGTHDGPLLGLPPSGRSVVTLALDMIRVEDGRFADHWGGPDLFTLVQACGGRLVAEG
ncbi:ester cyclase [Ovoidimarina sediminis]|uniref:ester cyclase n=1 Tax=Ovoidimarina sediminis TaxID=3079856 RepID=UPI0029061419|nr:ester cyclase [Rhodophyticola sp. MJ-SS7]MDU8943117.1 ester cyclase [Rhodophyticola sp. MJ-SS7]